MALRALSICLLLAALTMAAWDALYSPVGSPALHATTLGELLPLWFAVGVVGLGFYAVSRMPKFADDQASTAAYGGWPLIGLLAMCAGLFALIVELLPYLAVGTAPRSLTIAELWAQSHPATTHQYQMALI